YWGYLNLTVPAILQPVGLNPAPLRMYNFMHYGRGEGLSALLAATVAAPVVFVLLILALRRLLFRWLIR
ncbi:MAG: hypothetical protein ACREJB_07220, partial [Planctomycetaceae bacterium]